MICAFKMRERLWRKQSGKCCYCGDPTHLPRYNQKELKSNNATIEHLTPKSKGGSDDILNLKMACHKCNLVRGTMDVTEFYEIAQNKTFLNKLYKEKIEHTKKYIPANEVKAATKKDANRFYKKKVKHNKPKNPYSRNKFIDYDELYA